MFKENLLEPRAVHYQSLDGVRGLAILMVVFFHLFHGAGWLHSALPRSFSQVSSIGQMGVDLFFVLSGFLITTILLRTRSKDFYFRNFFARRSLRIFPLYYLFLSVCLCLPKESIAEIPSPEASPWWMWTYLANIPPTLSNSAVRFPHLWSLAVEEQFYLVWPFAIRFLPRSRIAMACSALILLGPFCRWLFIQSSLSPFYALPCRVDSLAAGALIASLRDGGLADQMLRRWAFGLMAFSVLVGIPCFWLFAGAGASWIQVIKHTLAVSMFGALIVVAVTPGRLGRLLEWKPLRYLGKYSYCIYLIHPVAIVVANRFLMSRDWQVIEAAVFYVAFVVMLTLVVSHISWLVVERPALSLKKYFEL